MTGPERRRRTNAFLPTTTSPPITAQQQQPQPPTPSESGDLLHHVLPLLDDASTGVAGETESCGDWSIPVRGGHNRTRGSRDNDSILESSSSAVNGGLHQRHNVVRRAASDDPALSEGDYERGGGGGVFLRVNAFQSKYQQRSRAGGNNPNKQRTYPFARWLRTCVLAGIPAYLLLIFLFLKRMNHRHALTLNRNYNNNMMLDYTNHETVTAIRNLHAVMETDLNSRRIRDEREWNEAATANQQATERAWQRKERTTPPLHPGDWVMAAAPIILSVEEWERPDTLYRGENNNDDTDAAAAAADSEKLLRNAKQEEICGFQAQNAALQTPTAFPYSDSLTMPRSRVARVLITGVLSQPAYLLALALKERCNVQIMIGFDAMYPNSIRNRLRLMEQMAVLSKYIPKMVRPIFIAFAGMDPLKHAKNFHAMEGTGEIDILQTFHPTHIVHLASYDPALFRYNADPEWKNRQSPYVRTVVDDGSSTTTTYDPSLYAIRMGMLAMEQLLAAIAAAPVRDRPHLIYASSSSNPGRSRRHDEVIHQYARKIDEVMADVYYQNYGVYSVGVRLPNAIYGPWGHPEQDLFQMLDSAVANAPTSNTSHTDGDDELDLLHVDDVVDGLIAAMQYRPPSAKPTLFEFSSGKTFRLRQIHEFVRQVLDRSSSRSGLSVLAPSTSLDENVEASQKNVQHALGWSPQVPVEQGLVRTVAWHLDRRYPYGPPLGNATDIETGDALLKRHALSTVAPDEILGYGGRPFLPCASECGAHRDQCVPTVFDELVPMVQELTEECDIVLYTQDFDKNAEDFVLQSEFMDEGDPLICNFAFVASESPLVETVIDKVPDSELGKLGFEMTAEIANRPGGIRRAKFENLNGRLLYRGWILIWTMNTPDELPTAERFFLKLSPGRLFHDDVKAAVFIDQGFGVSPKADDIEFLVHEMHRKPWKARVVKRKTRPKAKFLLPAEPQRRAVLLMSELKYQDSKDAERLSPDEMISTYEATRFMRFSNGEEPLGKEPSNIKLQREFYDRLRTAINPDTSRASVEPLHKFEMSHWVRSRWVAHDMELEEGRQLRCEWYQEHVLWETDLDQLSFAFVMERLTLDRKLAFHEPDEVVQKVLSEKTEMKRLLSDTFEWHALPTNANQGYSPYEEMQILPYDMDYTDERALIRPEALQDDDDEVPLFVRVISDRIMAYARKAWNTMKPTEEEESPDEDEDDSEL